MLEGKSIKAWGGFIALIVAIIAITSFAGVVYLYSNTLKIAYVDNERVLTEYNGVKEGRKLYTDKLNQWKSNLDTLEADVNRDIKKYQTDFQEMTLKERGLTEELIKKKQDSYFQYKKVIEEKVKDEDNKLTVAILNKIDSYLLDYGKSHKYDFIIGITDTGNLLYAREGNDITQEIITGLNKNYDGE